MVKKPFTTNPYPDLVVSESDRKKLLQVESDLILEMFPKYEEYVVRDQRKVNSAQWKAIGDDKNLHVYVARKGRWDEAGTGESYTQDTADNWQKHMPILLAVGTFEGELDDLMFGTVNPSQDVMRIKASYVNDYSDGAVLANIVMPTADFPFRSVSVKWTQINLPLNQTGLIRNRDFICLEATGILRFKSGERVGYQLLHSIDFPNTQPLPGVIRARHKIIGFYRQISHNVIDTFAYDTVHPGGKLFRSIALEASAKALLSTTNYVVCGQAKKLTWRMQYRHAETRLYRQQRVAQNMRVGSASCGVCKRNLALRRFGLPRVGALGRSVCKLCMSPVCHKCKRPKGISFLTPDGELLRHKITFCVICVSEVTHLNAVPAAQDQAKGYQAYKVMASLSGSDILSDDLTV